MIASAAATRAPGGSVAIDPHTSPSMSARTANRTTAARVATTRPVTGASSTARRTTEAEGAGPDCWADSVCSRSVAVSPDGILPSLACRRGLGRWVRCCSRRRALARVGGSVDRQDREQAERQPQRGRHSCPMNWSSGEEIPAASSVAMVPSSAAAAFTTGSAVNAPVPSPSRISRSSTGVSSRAARAIE